MSYFNNFPIVDYNGVTITNIFKKLQVNESAFSNPSLFFSHEIQDGDTPENLADKVYGSPDHYWIILLVNDIHNVFTEWPKDQLTLNRFVEKTYGVGNQNNVHHYENENGLIVDANYQGLVRKKVTNYQHEERENNNRREIRMLVSSYVPQIVEQARTAFR